MSEDTWTALKPVLEPREQVTAALTAIGCKLVVTDRHLILVDPGHGLLHEFWQAKLTDAGWQASNVATFEQLHAAFAQWPAASQNVAYADASGNIGVQLIGQVPRRKKGHGLLDASLGQAIFNDTLPKGYPFVRKQAMQLGSKMRFLACQFEALLENDLWLKNARHANAMAKLLASARLRPRSI